MSTTPVPRLVGATWYPVPCPEGVPLTLGFPSEEACAAFIVGSALVNNLRQQWEFEAEEMVEEADSEGHDRGYGDGFEACKEVVTSAIEAA